MKVGILSFRLEPDTGGGAERSAWLVAHGLRNLGIDVFAITTHAGPDDVIRLDGLRIHRLSPRNLYWVGHKDDKPTAARVAWQLMDLWNPFQYRAVRRILARERPDIAHVQKLRGLSPSVWQAAGAAGIQRIIQTCRDYELTSPESMFSTRVGKLAERESLILRPYKSLRARLSASVDVATAPSAYTLQVLTARGFFPNAMTRVIPNSHGCTRSTIEERRRDTPRRREEPSSASVLYLGRLEEYKGVGGLCAVVEDLASRGVKLTLDVAGGGTQALVLRERYGRCDAITFHGPVFGSDKDSLLERCSVVVIPSQWPEVFGNVVVEAFSYGKPVIGTRMGGIPELIAEGRTGWLVDAGSLEGLRVHLARIATNPASVSALRDNCFEAAFSYTTDRLVAEHVALYEELLGRKAG
jgi:glycosyltransferase involved in cell wall biosynthesis